MNTILLRSLLSVLAAIQSVPALSCPTPGLTEGERMSREGGAIFVGMATSNSEMAAHAKIGRAIRAQLEGAVVAEHPDWQLIERLQNEEQIWRANLARLSHEGTLRILRELGPRDRAIYLKTIMSEPTPRSLPGDALKENHERAEAIRLKILASANCLIPDQEMLTGLLAESLSLELERRKLVNAWSAGLNATESLPKRLERLRREYRSAPPPPSISAPTRTRSDADRPFAAVRPLVDRTAAFRIRKNRAE